VLRIVRERLDSLIPACKFHRKNPRGRTQSLTAKEFISLLNENPSSIALSQQFRRKHLQYAEDIRPAYNGTFTRRTKFLTPRNPFKRDPEIFAYEYDSEAEWEFEPEDGENLDDESTGDDEEVGSMMEDSGDEEDRAFLDDDDDDDTTNNTVKATGKKRFVAPLVPMTKGVCWESTEGIQEDEMLAGMRASILLFDDKGDEISGPINPFSSEYWAMEMPPPAPKIDSLRGLKKLSGTGTVEFVKTSAKTKTPFPDALLGDFLRAIHGTTHNQILMIELLKKQ
jgi:chromatin assembly factor 1 subunit A